MCKISIQIAEASGTRTPSTSTPQPTSSSSCAPYWLESIKHQGLSPFNNASGYRIFRDVKKDYAAKGDGLTDDTDAIQKALGDGGRCGPGVCNSTTRTPAIVYIPEGTYLISKPIIDYYYTMIIGNPNCLPTLLVSPSFNTSSSTYVLDGDPFMPGQNGKKSWIATNTFFRQVRNLIFDMTQFPSTQLIQGMHWPTSQTTSLQNLVFRMATGKESLHEGIFSEEGSAGFMTDLAFYGGNIGFHVGNQQFTTRNLTFDGCNTAINQLWSWGWTYSGVTINNCQTGLNMSHIDGGNLTVGSITLFDSSIKNTKVGILTARTTETNPDSAGSLYLENVEFHNVTTPIALEDSSSSPENPGKTLLESKSGNGVFSAWATGHRYLPHVGGVDDEGMIAMPKRPTTLLDKHGGYLVRSKPQYESVPRDQFMSARDLGCKGDGTTDDTAALNIALTQAAAERKILFVDAGFYLVTDTIRIPPGSRIVGEALASVILSSGELFNVMEDPRPVVQVGLTGNYSFWGQNGTVEWSDMLVSTRGQQRGAILIEWNLGSYDGEVSGMWDVHTRIGGFAGSNLGAKECPTTPDVTVTNENLNKDCIGAYMSMHVTRWGSGLYMENNWLWTADHDLDDPIDNNTQITVYNGRGLFIESQRGIIWLYGTAVEHHVKYQYQFANTRDIFMGQVQTETAYYQPNPDATLPFGENATYFDPVFTPSSNTSDVAANGWGMRIIESSNIFGYGVGLYSFFNNYSTACSAVFSETKCQSRIFSLEGGAHNYDVKIYNLNTVGATSMITVDDVDIALNVDNNSTFVDTINVFRTHQD
ncbi:exo-beta-1,3-glucanase-like protein [Lophiotrema nucula]|uniref:Exo-beta-1,3-glucanase-like protein n=1 Tax=Lophiotrema nucula TaxID=690887 RepID=A0A6A5ZHD6_9PLEO|nr:exo-beta-1,3-glucanase-like protein [Lophiotrema nucula]